MSKIALFGNINGNGTFTISAPISSTDYVLALPTTTGTLMAAEPDGNLSVRKLNSGQLAGMRNKIINGKMEIAQRGTSFVSPATASYTLDRWRVDYVTSATVTVSQQADVPSSNEFQDSLRVAVTAADTSIASTDTFTVSQMIEGFNVRDLIGKSFVLSFWVRSSKTGTHCVSFTNSSADRSYVVEYTIFAANTWEKKAILISGGLITAGTWDWENGIGLNVRWALAAGTNFHAAAGSWVAANDTATSSQVNCLDTIGNIFALTGVQLEVGTLPTEFEHRFMGAELSLCQRYYEEIYTRWGTTNANAAIQHAVYFNQRKRTTPVATIYADVTPYAKTGAVNNVRNRTAGANVAATVALDTGQVDTAALDYTGVNPANWSTTITLNAEL